MLVFIKFNELTYPQSDNVTIVTFSRTDVKCRQRKVIRGRIPVQCNINDI